MKKALVTGVGRYLPERKITTEEMEEMAGYDKFGVRYGLCKMLTGCETRYYAAEDEYSSDLSMKASLKAMEQAGVQPVGYRCGVILLDHTGFCRACDSQCGGR